MLNQISIKWSPPSNSHCENPNHSRRYLPDCGSAGLSGKNSLHHYAYSDAICWWKVIPVEGLRVNYKRLANWWEPLRLPSVSCANLSPVGRYVNSCYLHPVTTLLSHWRAMLRLSIITNNLISYQMEDGPASLTNFQNVIPQWQSHYSFVGIIKEISWSLKQDHQVIWAVQGPVTSCQSAGQGRSWSLMVINHLNYVTILYGSFLPGTNW